MSQPSTPENQQNNPQAYTDQQYAQGYQNQAWAPSAYSAPAAGQPGADPNIYGQPQPGYDQGYAYGQPAYGVAAPQPTRSTGGFAGLFSTNFKVRVSSSIAGIVQLFALIAGGIVVVKELFTFIRVATNDGAVYGGASALAILEELFQFAYVLGVVVVALGLVRAILEIAVKADQDATKVEAEAAQASQPQA
ncbi:MULTISPECIES: hypothetical protein [unclassified Actinobaculum]|uniref:hypothetical protein n=1 Tax=unclassified Actinobaculum TaxID=2609299 RepID=UPI000D52815E|nr:MULTISPECIES: hypothetical protein [unclassified Actinobaculum]AWE42275.1 hypothetical protein DDD63_05390 [Actinobaculum sp. 313]